MTLGDLLTLLRARKAGAYYSDVAEAVEIPILSLVRAERTFSTPRLTPEELTRLAEYFGVPVERLEEARRRSRADFTSYLAACEKDHRSATLTLVGQETVSGTILWRDRHAVALRQPDGSVLVVYRSNVDSWEEDGT
ncbi:MAG TPA: hypothetical protein VFZ25_19830 [Chloroflexota bacterium]|nr:hypothetical protein [Chloroflexota bacterium]